MSHASWVTLSQSEARKKFFLMNERIFIQANAPSGKIFDPKLNIFENHEKFDFSKIPKLTKNKKLLELERR